VFAQKKVVHAPVRCCSLLFLNPAAPPPPPTPQNKMKINDWSAIQSLFDDLNKRLDKARKVSEGVGVPKLYLRMIVELEDFLTGGWVGGWVDRKSVV